MNKIGFVWTDARGSLGRILLTAMCSTLLTLAMLLGSGCGEEKGTITYQSPPEPQSRDWLFDVYGSGPNDIYACGNKGAMFHYSGVGSPLADTSWTYIDMGTTTAIVTLWEDAGTFYAVGHGGRIWRIAVGAEGQWNSMASGTSKNLYGIGSFQDEIYACGAEGTLRRLSGSNWVSSGRDSMVILDALNTCLATDTLLVASDLSSLLTVNNFFIGGAFHKANYDPDELGIGGTDGMIFEVAPNLDLVCEGANPPHYDQDKWWRLRPLRGDQLAEAEWVLCTTSDIITSRNYLGTSEGWVFELLDDPNSDSYIWVKHYPRLTIDEGNGIRDMWLDENANLFMVTDDGQLVVQSANYEFGTVGDPDSEDSYRRVLYDQVNSLVGIWGTGSDNFYMVGLVENQILHGSVDLASGDPATVTEIAVPFPNKGGGMYPFEDELGRPRF